jgi:serine/threonine-protein kinase
VPDVTSQTEAQARAQLQRAGFEVQVVEEIVTDQSLGGKVLSKDPEGGTDAEEGTTVVIVVGRFEAAPPPPTEPTETDTAPIP